MDLKTRNLLHLKLSGNVVESNVERYIEDFHAKASGAATYFAQAVEETATTLELSRSEKDELREHAEELLRTELAKVVEEIRLPRSTM